MNYLLAWAHTQAIESLLKKTSASYVIIDQFANKSLVEGMIKRKKIEIKLKQMPRAESDIVVAGASILARANFLKGLESLSKKIGIKLLKGASYQIINLGVKIFNKKGKNIFSDIAKTHFKTFKDILKKVD